MGVRADFLTGSRSQTGVEYLIVLAMFLFLLAGIFVYTNINYVDTSRTEQASDAVRVIASAADRLYAMQPGTKTYVYVTLPSGIISTRVYANEISIKLSISKGPTEVVATTGARVNGSVPTEEGIQKIMLEVLESGIVYIGGNATTSFEDLIPPIVTFIPPTPDNGANVTIGSYTINAAVTDNLSPITSCVLYLNGSPKAMNIVGSGTSVTCNYQVSLPTGRTYTYYVAAVDGALNLGKSETRTITVKRKGVKDAMLFYYIDISKGVVGPLKYNNKTQYRLWNKIAFSSEYEILTNKTDLGWYALASNPIRNEKIFLFKENSNDANVSAYAAVWNGTGWSSLIRLTNRNCDGALFGTLDVAYEQLTGKAMVVYGDINKCDGYVAYRIWDGSSWSEAKDFPSSTYMIKLGDYHCVGTLKNIKLASNPLSKEITAVIQGSNGLSANTWSPSGILQTAEVCDNKDNDFNGLIDDGLIKNCPEQLGICGGITVCSEGQWDECFYGPQYEVNETMCDEVDNDCDGDTDEGCLELISCMDNDGDGFGNEAYPTDGCRHLEPDCIDNMHEVHPYATETCNNVNDDCDSQTDENVFQNCSYQLGVCAGATQTCTSGAWSSCYYGINYQYAETRCDGKDNDCDGTVDEVCQTDWSNSTTFSNGSITSSVLNFDVAYEQYSGRAMVAWQEDLTYGPSYSIWNGTAWSASKRASLIGAIGKWYELDSRRNTNMLLLTTYDSDNHLNAQFWDGSSWGAPTELAQGIMCVNEFSKCFGAAFEQISEPFGAVVRYNIGGGLPSGGNSFWNGSRWINTPISIGPIPPTPVWVTLEPDIYSDEILSVYTTTDEYARVEDWYPGMSAMQNVFSTPLNNQIISTLKAFAISFDKRPL